jgi:hypothetical protein
MQKFLIILITISLFGLTACESERLPQEQTSLRASVEDIKNSHMRTRLLTLVHRWLELVENPERTPEPFQEIIAEDILFNFSSGAIENFEDLSAWINGPASSVAYSKHELSEFRFEKISEAEYTLWVTMDWNGLLPNGKHMTAKTLHNWTVVDNPSDRFARIKTIKVEVLEPFIIVEG